jgi:hypothetical protein
MVLYVKLPVEEVIEKQSTSANKMAERLIDV